MQRFRFRLDSVLRWRETSADLEQGKLDTLLADRERLVRQQADLARLVEQHRDSLRDPRFTAPERAAFDDWHGYAKRVRAATESAILDCDHRIAQQRAAVSEARRKAELLRRLRSRRHAEWTAESARIEQAEIEEMVISRWRPG